MIVTGGSLKESKEALKVAKTYSELLPPISLNGAA